MTTNKYIIKFCKHCGKKLEAAGHYEYDIYTGDRILAAIELRCKDATGEPGLQQEHYEETVWRDAVGKVYLRNMADYYGIAKIPYPTTDK